MSNEEKILEMLVAMDARQQKTDEILTAMQADIRQINGRLDSIENRLDSLENRMDSLEDRMDSLEDRMDLLEQKLDDLTEAHEETRSGVNALLEWSDRVSSIETLHIPRI